MTLNNENNNFYSVIIISNNSMEIDIGVQEGSTAEYDGIEFGEYETVSLMEYGDAEDLVDSAEEIYHFIKNNSDKSFEEIINDLEDEFDLETVY